MSTRGTRSTISFTCATTMPVLEGGRLDDGRRVFGVGPGVEIAVAIGADRRDQRHMRRQVDEVAGEQLEIGVDGAELDLPGVQQPRDAAALCGPE